MAFYWMIAIMMAAGASQAEECSVDVHILTGVATPNTMMLDSRSQVSAMFRKIGIDVRVRMGRPFARDN
jgi:hypothetical protein